MILCLFVSVWFISLSMLCCCGSHSVVSYSLPPRGYSLWNSLGQNTEMGSLSLLQDIFPIQESNPILPYCRQILYQLRIRESLSIMPSKANQVAANGNVSFFLWLSSIPLCLVSSSHWPGPVPSLPTPCSEARLSLHSLHSSLFAIKLKTGPSHLASLSPRRLGRCVWDPQGHLVPSPPGIWVQAASRFSLPLSAAPLRHALGKAAAGEGSPRPSSFSLFLRMLCLYRQPNLCLTLQFNLVSFLESQGKHRRLLK